MTFSQLQSQFFTSKYNCSRRLRYLLNDGYLEVKLLKDLYGARKNTYSFPHLIYLKLSPNSKIYSLSKPMRSLLPEYDNVFKSSILLHQLYLGEVRNFFSSYVVHDHLYSEYEIKLFSKLINDRNCDIEPDLSFESKEIKLAVELERTKKVKARYFSKFYNFYDSSYSHVLYIFLDLKTLNSVMSYTRIYRKIGFVLFDKFDEVYSPTLGKLKLDDWIHTIDSFRKA